MQENIVEHNKHNTKRVRDVANPPICGPFLILSPAVKLWGPPIRQG